MFSSVLVSGYHRLAAVATRRSPPLGNVSCGGLHYGSIAVAMIVRIQEANHVHKVRARGSLAKRRRDPPSGSQEVGLILDSSSSGSV